MGTKAFALYAIVAVSLAVTGSHPARLTPERLIKIVVPFPAGGPSDVAVRLVTQPLSSKSGQSVIIENLPAAGARTGAKAVAQASPDGYTLLLGATNPNAIAAQSLDRNLNSSCSKTSPRWPRSWVRLQLALVGSAVRAPRKRCRNWCNTRRQTLASSRLGPDRWNWSHTTAWSCFAPGPAPLSPSFRTREPRPRSRIYWAERYRSA